MFSVLLQLKVLVSENMKISKYSQNCFLKKERVEFSIKFPVIYVNIKKSIQKQQQQNCRKRL